jgi:hypothetical protein
VEQRQGTTADRLDPALDGAATPFLPADEPGLPDVRAICPYLGSEFADGRTAGAIGRPDSANRCIALGEGQPQSERQQALVCLTASHVNCPRYLRGVLLAGTPPPKTRQPISVAVIGSALVLAAALAASFGFLIVRGGFELPIASPGASPFALAASATPAARGSEAPTIASSPSPSPLTPPSPEPSASPALTPVPSATPVPTARPTPAPTSDRYALLTRCPSTPDCWIYTIRAGDNLQSIANWFGVSYDRVRAMNPGLSVPIHAGDRLRIPTPTR